VTGLALTVAQHYGLVGLRGLELATRALSAAFDRGFAELPELHELLAPESWTAWLVTYPPCDGVDNDCDDVDGDGYVQGNVEDCDGVVDDDCDDDEAYHDGVDEDCDDTDGEGLAVAA